MELHQAILAARHEADALVEVEKKLERWVDCNDPSEPIYIKGKGGRAITTPQDYHIFKCATPDEAIRVAGIIRGLAIKQQEKRIDLMKRRVAELFAGVSHE